MTEQKAVYYGVRRFNSELEEWEPFTKLVASREELEQQIEKNQVGGQLCAFVCMPIGVTTVTVNYEKVQGAFERADSNSEDSHESEGGEQEQETGTLREGANGAVGIAGADGAS